MTDKELLELAAKAAGIELDHWNDGSEPYSSGEGFILPSNAIWNPLTDDGDALRLACALRINIYFGHEGKGPIDCGQFGEANAREWDAGTGQESLRRAIVRAAAVIGKAM